MLCSSFSPAGWDQLTKQGMISGACNIYTAFPRPDLNSELIFLSPGASPPICLGGPRDVHSDP